MNVSFMYGNWRDYGVRQAIDATHVRTVVFDKLYMTLVFIDGHIERYIYGDVSNLLLDRKDNRK